MKSNNILGFILEGTDGVGKTTLKVEIAKKFNYSYFVYDRGDISNYVYSKIYNREFIPMQKHLPILNIILYSNKEDLRKRILERDKNSVLLDAELSKIEQQDYFLQAYEDLKNDYNIILVDTSNTSIEEATNLIFIAIKNFINNSEQDTELSNWDKNYKKGCEKLNLNFTVCNKQPRINNIPICTDNTCYNGVYERFVDSKFPISLIYSLSYDNFSIKEKKFDFCYIINSKINSRHEVFEYYNSFIKNKKTCLIANNNLIPDNKYLIKMKDRIFGNEYIEYISQAKSTIYCARELNYLEMLNARFYESILAENIIFIDKESDKNNKLLNDIYKDDKELIDLLYITPDTICKNYKIIIEKNLTKKIILKQHEWFNSRLNKLKGEIKK